MLRGRPDQTRQLPATASQRATNSGKCARAASGLEHRGSRAIAGGGGTRTLMRTCTHVPSCASVRPYIYPSPRIYHLSIYRRSYLIHIHLSICPSTLAGYPSVHVHLSTCLSVFSVCPVCLSVSLSICPYVCSSDCPPILCLQADVQLYSTNPPLPVAPKRVSEKG